MNIFATEQGILEATDYARQHNTFHVFLTLTRSIRKQLAAYQRRSNDHIMTCLGMRYPMRCLACIRGSCSRQGHPAHCAGPDR